MNSTLKIISVNCQGLGNKQKRRDVFHFLREKKYSIYFLQDTHFDEKLESYVSAEWGYKCFFSSFKTNSRGVAILFNNNFEFKVVDVFKKDDGNFFAVIIQVNNMNIVLKI